MKNSYLIICILLLTAVMPAFTKSPYLNAMALGVPERIAPLETDDNLLNKVQCFWHSVESAAEYEIQVSESPAFKPNLFYNGLVSDTSLTLNNLSFNTRYYWKIRSINGSDMSEWSQVWSFITRPAKLYVPHIVMPSLIEYPIDLEIFWTADNFAQSYQLEISEDSLFGSNVKQFSSRDSSILTNLEYHRKYFARVRAVNQIDTSKWSDLWKFSTISRFSPVKLLIPANDSVAVPVATWFEWEAQEFADTYTLEVSKDSMFKKLDSRTVFDATSITILYSDYQTKYYWRVQANAPKDTSNWSDVWSFTTRNYFVGNVIAVYPPHKSKDIPLPVKFQWEPFLNAKYYNLTVTPFKGGAGFVYGSSTWALSDLVENLKYGSEYYWTIRPVRDEVKFYHDTQYRFSTKSPFTDLELISPGNLSVNIPTNTDFLWKKQELARGYILEYSIDSLMINSKDSVSLTDTIYSASLSPGTKYYWRVQATYYDQKSEWSETRVFTSSTNTGISDNIESENSVYPQPASSDVFVRLKASNDGEVEINFYNPYGELTQSSISNSSSGLIKLNVSGLPSGVYQVLINAAGKIYKERIIVAR